MINLDRIRMPKDFNYLQRPVIRDKKKLFLDRKIGINDEIDQLRIASYIKNQPKPRQVLDADEMKARRIRDFGIKVDLGVKDLVDKYKNKTFKVMRRDNNGNIMKNPETGMPIFKNVLWREVLGNDTYLLDRVNQISGYGNEESQNEALLLRKHIMNNAVDPRVGYTQSMLSALKRLNKKFPPENWSAEIQKWKTPEKLAGPLLISTYHSELRPNPPNEANEFTLMILFHFMSYNLAYINAFLDYIYKKYGNDQFNLYKEIQEWKKKFKIKFPDDIYGEELDFAYPEDYMRKFRISKYGSDHDDDDIISVDRVKSRFNDIKMTADEIIERSEDIEIKNQADRFGKLWRKPKNDDELAERDVYDLTNVDEGYDPFEGYISAHLTAVDSIIRSKNSRFADLLIDILNKIMDEDGDFIVNLYNIIYLVKITIATYEYKIDASDLNANFLTEYINYDKLRRDKFSKKEIEEKETEEKDISDLGISKEDIPDDTELERITDPFDFLKAIGLKIPSNLHIDSSVINDYKFDVNWNIGFTSKKAFRYYLEMFLNKFILIDSNPFKDSFRNKSAKEKHKFKFLKPGGIITKIEKDKYRLTWVLRQGAWRYDAV